MHSHSNASGAETIHRQINESGLSGGVGDEDEGGKRVKNDGVVTINRFANNSSSCVEPYGIPWGMISIKIPYH